MKTCSRKSIMAGILVLFLAVIVPAESFILQGPPVAKRELGFRYLRPDFKEDSSLSFLSGVYDFSVSFQLNSRLDFVGNLPFGVIGMEGEDTEIGMEGEDTESGIGNIYLGLRHRLKFTAETKLCLSLGVLLPTMSEDKWEVLFIGMFSNYYEFDKYMPNIMTFYGNLVYQHINPGGLILGVEIGPKLWIPTKSDEGTVELLINYGLSAGFRTGSLTFMAEWAGVGFVTTESAGNFADRFFHMAAFGVHWASGPFRPGVFYKIYLKKEMRDLVSGVIGIKLDVILQE